MEKLTEQEMKQFIIVFNDLSKLKSEYVRGIAALFIVRRDVSDYKKMVDELFKFQ